MMKQNSLVENLHDLPWERARKKTMRSLKSTALPKAKSWSFSNLINLKIHGIGAALPKANSKLFEFENLKIHGIHAPKAKSWSFSKNPSQRQLFENPTRKTLGKDNFFENPTRKNPRQRQLPRGKTIVKDDYVWTFFKAKLTLYFFFPSSNQLLFMFSSLPLWVADQSRGWFETYLPPYPPTRAGAQGSDSKTSCLSFQRIPFFFRIRFIYAAE